MFARKWLGTALAVGVTFLDTSSFATLSGVTGYRLNRVATGTNVDGYGGGHYIADSFQFQPVAVVPVPATALIFAVGAGLAVVRSRRRGGVASPAA